MRRAGPGFDVVLFSECGGPVPGVRYTGRPEFHQRLPARPEGVQLAGRDAPVPGVRTHPPPAHPGAGERPEAGRQGPLPSACSVLQG